MSQITFRRKCDVERDVGDHVRRPSADYFAAADLDKDPASVRAVSRGGSLACSRAVADS